jgi:hypothetical protein
MASPELSSTNDEKRAAQDGEEALDPETGAHEIP